MLDQAYSRRQFLGLAGGLASIVGLGLVGCGGSNAANTAAEGSAAAAESVSGEVTYDGASSFQALVEAAAEKFMDANPDVSVSGSGNGSGKGLTAVAAGTVTIGNSDVFAETKLEADQVKNLVDHEVAVVGMGPVVSKNVKVDDLSLEQLKGIFSGQITNWKEVGGDDAKIVVLNRKAGSGTRATFEAAVFGDEAVDFKGDAELDKSGDVQTQMGSTDNAISYLDFSHFDDSKFNAVKVEGVEPKSKNVTDDSFKIWATEHMYCSKDADEATTAFLEFMLSDDVQGKLVEEQGFIPVSAMKVVKDASGNKLKLTDKGNGKYSVTVYRNVSGTSYQQVESKSMNVTVKDSYAPYLVSTSEVQFSKGDTVSAKAVELCKNAKTDEAKVIAIYNYMADRYSYDYKLANEITSGKITKYIPDTAATLKGTTGICYDFSSLFAAMCRSQGIPCALTKGYAGSSYHAWNKVNLNGKWYQIDLTYAVTRSVKNAKTLHDCVSPLTYTNTSDALAVAAA